MNINPEVSIDLIFVAPMLTFPPFYIMPLFIAYTDYRWANFDQLDEDENAIFAHEPITLSNHFS
jgi:hypothetical protein